MGKLVVKGLIWSKRKTWLQVTQETLCSNNNTSRIHLLKISLTPANIYLLKVYNKITRKCELCSNLTIDVVLVSLLLILDIFHSNRNNRKSYIVSTADFKQVLVDTTYVIFLHHKVSGKPHSFCRACQGAGNQSSIAWCQIDLENENKNMY